MKKALVVLAVGAVLSMGASCNNQGDPDGYPEIEIEDCDHEDWKNYDPECGRGPSPRPMKTAYQKAPTPKQKAPTTRSTRR